MQFCMTFLSSQNLNKDNINIFFCTFPFLYKNVFFKKKKEEDCKDLLISNLKKIYLTMTEEVVCNFINKRNMYQKSCFIYTPLSLLGNLSLSRKRVLRLQ